MGISSLEIISDTALTMESGVTKLLAALVSMVNQVHITIVIIGISSRAIISYTVLIMQKGTVMLLADLVSNVNQIQVTYSLDYGYQLLGMISDTVSTIDVGKAMLPRKYGGSQRLTVVIMDTSTWEIIPDTVSIMYPGAVMLLAALESMVDHD